LCGLDAGGPSVPQTQWGHPIGVNMLGGAFKFGESGDLPPTLLRTRMVDFE
jgi:hypothetical protein